MRFPVVRERVRVQGRDGTFLVLSVDRARGVAGLASAGKGGQVEEDVPLSSILPLADGGRKPAKDESASS
jgi:hypothetical protein